MQLPKWEGLKDCVCKLTTVIEDYCAYLDHQCKSAKLSHNSLVSISISEVINFLPKIPLVGSRIKEIDCVVSEKPCYEQIFVNEFCPVESRKKYLFIQELKKGLTVSAISCTFSMGSRLGNYQFLWKLPESVTVAASTPENVCIIIEIKATLPTFHSHTLRREFINRYGAVAGIKSHVLHQIYRGIYVLYSLYIFTIICILSGFLKFCNVLINQQHQYSKSELMTSWSSGVRT